MITSYRLLFVALLVFTTSHSQDTVTPRGSRDQDDDDDDNNNNEAKLFLNIQDQIIANLTLDDFPTLNPNGNNDNSASLLKYGELTTNLKCLRLFQARDFNGDWGDLCSSNELLSRGFIWSTRSVCSPKDQWYDSKRYWLLFEEPGFRGRYIMLAGERCIGRLENTRLTTFGSVLQCSVERGMSAQKVRCHYPPEPWRKFRPFSERDARREVEQSTELVRQTNQNVVGGVSATVAGSGPQFSSTNTEFNVDDLTKNSLDSGK